MDITIHTNPLAALYFLAFIPLAVRALVFGKHTPAGKMGLVKPRWPRSYEILRYGVLSFLVAQVIDFLLGQAAAPTLVSALVFIVGGTLHGLLVGRGTPKFDGPEFETAEPPSSDDSVQVL